MNSQEIESLITQLKAQGLNEDEIMDIFYQTFVDAKMDRKDLEALAEAMGYELTDDFKDEASPDPIAAREEAGVSDVDLEDAKAIEPGESVEEFKEEIKEAQEGLGQEEKSESEEDKPAEPEEKEEKEEKSEEKIEEKSDSDGEEKEESEEEEWEKAQKMFKI